MRQTAKIISTYSADTFGVCSALFELDGMVVMHDPSGCNSTYTTHDEPRWYDMDSRIYISGLTEYDAIMGNDAKLVREVVETAQAQRPRFIALLATPVPTMVGTDLAAAARLVEKETGIPCFTLDTNSMHFYVRGVSQALAWVAEQVVAQAGKAGAAGRLRCARCGPDAASAAGEPDRQIRVNILGVTPLDFAMNGSEASLRAWLEREGFAVQSCWARGDTLDNILASGVADVNLVVSAGGLAAAKILQDRLGLPYVAGVPFGAPGQKKLAGKLREAASAVGAQPAASADTAGRPRCAACGSGATLKNTIPLAGLAARGAGASNPPPQAGARLAIGEAVFMQSLAEAIEAETGEKITVICPVETHAELLREDTILATDETELEPYLKEAAVIIADPMYQPVCPQAAKFVPLPHVGFSGRLYLGAIPNLIDGLDEFLKELMK